ncbi:hypothetical protein C1I99_25125 [Micromonospora deserti]|uniref:YcxB-like protein domain-containing protein n=2 Tax=Micromonospora deserti TaxID=2070366 RepID=A0A2W2BW42_9ACTN|nr:hypothetical protein C1I99_25125 [Micromonospora deserti]
MINFETPPDRRLLAVALRHAFRRTLRLLVVCGFLLLLPATVDLLADRPVRVAGWVVAALVFWLSPRFVVRGAVENNWKTYGVPIAWQLSDEGLRMSTRLMESLLRWEALETVELIPGQLLFRVNRQQVVPVPIAGLSPHDRDALLGFLGGRGLLAGGEQAAGGATVTG